MSGVAVVNYLLRNNFDLLQDVPIERIVSGDLSQTIVRPAIIITKVDSYPNRVLTGDVDLRTERVQATVLVNGPLALVPGEGYPAVQRIINTIATGRYNQRGLVNGILVDSVLFDSEGPDTSIPEQNLYSGSCDFIVRWTAR